MASLHTKMESVATCKIDVWTAKAECIRGILETFEDQYANFEQYAEKVHAAKRKFDAAQKKLKRQNEYALTKHVSKLKTGGFPSAAANGMGQPLK